MCKAMHTMYKMFTMYKNVISAKNNIRWGDRVTPE